MDILQYTEWIRIDESLVWKIPGNVNNEKIKTVTWRPSVRLVLKIISTKVDVLVKLTQCVPRGLTLPPSPG